MHLFPILPRLWEIENRELVDIDNFKYLDIALYFRAKANEE